MATVDVAYPNALLDFARLRQLDADALVAQVGLDRPALAEANARVGSDKVYALFDALAELTGDQTVGLSVAEATVPDSGALAIVRYAASNSTTIREVAQRAAELLTIVDDTNQAIFEEDEHTGRYGLVGPQPPTPINRFAVQYSLAQQYRVARLIAKKPFVPMAVHFVQPAPDKGGERFAEVFHCQNIRYAQPRDEIVLDVEVLSRGIVGADPALGRLLYSMAQARLAELPKQDSLEARARREIVTTLPEGAGLDLLAKRMSMSERTLQRRLKEAGLTHKALVNETRQGLAERMVLEGRMQQTDIAYLLGYSDTTAFARAFRRWFGQSPSAFCRAASEA